MSSFIQCCVRAVRVVASSYLQAAFRKLPTPAGRMVPRQTCSPSFQEPLERFVHTRHVTTGVRRSPSNLPGNHEDLRHPTSEVYDFYIKKSTWIQKPPQETQEKHLISCCSCQFDMLLIYNHLPIPSTSSPRSERCCSKVRRLKEASRVQ